MKAVATLAIMPAHTDIGAWDITQVLLVAGIVVLAAALALFWAIKRLLAVVAPPGEEPCGGACSCDASSAKDLGRSYITATAMIERTRGESDAAVRDAAGDK